MVGLVFDKVDADVGEHRHRLVDLVRRVFAGRQHFVELVVGDVALFLALGYDFFDDFRQRALYRTVISLFGGFGFTIFIYFCGHVQAGSLHFSVRCLSGVLCPDSIRCCLTA
jgi:hypothetical protein